MDNVVLRGEKGMSVEYKQSVAVLACNRVRNNQTTDTNIQGTGHRGSPISFSVFVVLRYDSFLSLL
jgi:hypothetical protein